MFTFLMLCTLVLGIIVVLCIGLIADARARIAQLEDRLQRLEQQRGGPPLEASRNRIRDMFSEP